MYDEIEDEKTREALQARENPMFTPLLRVKFHPRGCVLPRAYAKIYDRVRNLEVREDDIWVVSLPRSGTTWTQEIVWLLASGLDYEGAKAQISKRFLQVERDGRWYSPDLPKLFTTTSMDAIEEIEREKSPRFIKTHLPLNLLPDEIQTNKKRPKIIYIARNLKDVAVSAFHHHRTVSDYKGTMDDFVEEITSDLALYSPYWTHIEEFWNRRNEPNVHFVTYEARHKDIKGAIKSLGSFLGKSLSEDELDKLIDHVSFDAMKKNGSVNSKAAYEVINKLFGRPSDLGDHCRKGKVGTWKEELSQDSTMKLEAWIEKNKIPGIWESDSSTQ